MSFCCVDATHWIKWLEKGQDYNDEAGWQLVVNWAPGADGETYVVVAFCPWCGKKLPTPAEKG
jgi:hypothetical protein